MAPSAIRNMIMTNGVELEKVQATVLRFVEWLDRYGETSYDHQSYFASDWGRGAKALYYRSRLLGTLAVSPMILSEAFLPGARRFFWKPQRFPIADAHYAMGFAFLFQLLGEEQHYRRGVHFLEVLKETRCPGYERYCWGYPFNWETRTGTLWANTPFITTLPYVYEAFREVYLIDRDPRWFEIMRSIAEHALLEYRDSPVSPDAAACAYTPDPEDRGGIINASAYRAFLLARAAADFSEERYRRVADRNVNFVIESQNPDGSWYYSASSGRDFVDHFHTCFVLKALVKIESLRPNARCTRAIERGVQYYVGNLFTEAHMPKPFSRRPRLTVYRHELYDLAECINLAVLLRGRFPELDDILSVAVNRDEWQKPDGSFRGRRLLVGWDNTPMHRWGQSQMFRSLCFLLYQDRRSGKVEPVSEEQTV
jgi:hypothetical protein